MRTSPHAGSSYPWAIIPLTQMGLPLAAGPWYRTRKQALEFAKAHYHSFAIARMERIYIGTISVAP